MKSHFKIKDNLLTNDRVKIIVFSGILVIARVTKTLYKEQTKASLLTRNITRYTIVYASTSNLYNKNTKTRMKTILFISSIFWDI